MPNHQAVSRAGIRRTALGLCVVLVASLALAACGADSSDGGERVEGATPQGSSGDGERARLTKPYIAPPGGPPPKQLVIEDLEEGTGLPVRAGDKVTVHYLGIDMTGEVLYSSWRNGSPFIFEPGEDRYGQGFEEGIEGMRVGGRRKLSVPSDLAPFESPVIYVVDLLKVDRAPLWCVALDISTGLELPRSFCRGRSWIFLR